MKGGSASLAMEEMQISPQWNIVLSPKLKLAIPSVDKDVTQMQLTYTAGGT